MDYYLRNVLRALILMSPTYIRAFLAFMSQKRKEHAISLGERLSEEDMSGSSPDKAFELKFLRGKMTIEQFEQRRLAGCVNKYRSAREATRVQIARKWKIARGRGDVLIRSSARLQAEFLESVDNALSLDNREFQAFDDLTWQTLHYWEQLIDDEKNSMVESLGILNAYCKVRGLQPGELLGRFPSQKGGLPWT